MKATRTVVPVLLGAVLALAPLASASARPAAGPARRGPLVVAADLLTRLKLTPPQKARAFALLGRHKAEIVALGAAAIEAHVQLEDAIQAARPDPAAIQKAAATQAEVAVKVALLRARISPQAMAILTPAQKLEAMAVIAHAREWLGGPEQAQGPGRLKGPGPGHGPGKRLLKLLHWAGDQAQLTPRQRAQAKGVLESRRAQLMRAHLAERAAERALGQVVRQRAPDAKAVRQAAAEVAKARLDFALERAQIHAQIAGILTPAQRTRLEHARTEMQGVRLEQAHAILTLIRELL